MRIELWGGPADSMCADVRPGVVALKVDEDTYVPAPELDGGPLPRWRWTTRPSTPTVRES